MKTLSEIYNVNFSNPQLGEILKHEILNGADVNDRFFYFGNLIGQVSEKDLIDIYSLLKERGYVLPQLIIHQLIHCGYFELLSTLASDNFDINIKNSEGENALFYLVKTYNEPAHFKTRLKKAISLGVDYLSQNKQHENLLHAFACGGCPDEFLYELLALGLDTDKVNIFGYTPLHLLCVNRNTDGAIATLIDFGADTRIKTAPQSGYISELLGDYESENEGSYSAYELRMKYCKSIGGEYSEGTEFFEELKARYKELFKEED